jgi:glucosyl-dolichyl phosphate glucuronosyltransferase
MRKVSVIIPTYNRAHLIHLTINSFLNQSYPVQLYEIIVCDNNSTDSTKKTVHKIINGNPGRIKYLFEQRQGVHYARNSAAKVATGDILYYTDDDMIADENLLGEIIKIFELDSKIASVTGRVLPKWEVEPPKWIRKLCYNSLLSLNDPPEDLIISNNDCNVFSCHQAIKKDVFFATGGFNPENTAGEWIGDGETGLNIKIKNLGYKFGYNGRSIIHHIIPPQRMTQSYLNGRLANQGNCNSYTLYRENKYLINQLLKNIVKNVFWIFIRILFSALKYLLGKISWRISFAMIFYHINRIKYDIRLIISDKWRTFVLKDDWLIGE